MLQAPFGTVLFVISSFFSFAASAEDKARIAIIDASVDTRPFLNQLASAGVKVIGRYYSRCRQGGGLGEKRLIDNRGDSPGDGKSESERILSHEAKFGVLSVYQFYSNSPNKYVGRDSRGNLLPDENCERPDHQQPNDVTKEAQLDANAAVSQARVVRQPPKTPIFFGVDFDYAASHETLMLQYFETVAAIARTAGYEMGAYAMERPSRS